MNKTFKFFWLDGKTQIGIGKDWQDAFVGLGYRLKASVGLSHYKTIKPELN